MGTIKDILNILSLPRLLRTIFGGILGPIGFRVTAVDSRHDFNMLPNLINFIVLNFIFLA